MADFRQSVGHTLNGQLKVRVLVDRRGEVTVKVVKQGPGSSGLNANVRKISEFLSRRVRVEYIPASRTAEESVRLVRSEVQRVMRRLSQSDAYMNTLQKLNDLTSAALLPVQERLLEGVRRLVPVVNSLTFDVGVNIDRIYAEGIDIKIDDGLETSLETKGDGVQSLVAIALLRAAAADRTNATFILALEEPEAHLHPGAVRDLSEVLDELALEHQVILTTHSSILVRREDARANIIVQANSAAPSRNLAQVRNCLGVALPDNMQSAEVTLLVEGIHDARIFRHLLGRKSSIIASAFKAGRLVLKEAGGAQNIPYSYRLLAESVFSVHVILDDDAAGRAARRKLDQAGVPAKNITMLSSVNMSESELEDLFDESVFADHLLENYNVKCDPQVTQAGKRFSMRMGDYFANSGQTWTDSVASSLKAELACLLTDPVAMPEVRSDRESVVEAIQDAVIRKLLGKR